MFKNPLKYQQGGSTPTKEQQQLIAAFIQWLPTRVKEFQGMQPEEIAKALDGMSKTPEGQKQVQELLQEFQQEVQTKSQFFEKGGKIYDFICKHARGGKAGCGCKDDGGRIIKDQYPAEPIPEPDQSYFGTIQQDPYNSIGRGLRYAISNNPVTYGISRGIRNFGNTLMGGIVDFLTPDINSENGIMTAAGPAVKISKAEKAAQKAKRLKDFNYRSAKHNYANVPPTKMRDDFANLYNEATGHTGPLWDVLIEENGGNIESARDGSGTATQINSKTPGARMAKRNRQRNPYPNIGRRQTGTYVDENGNVYGYEYGDINGNTAQTYIKATPVDTVGVQYITTAYGDKPVYFNQNDDVWRNAIGPRMRPILNSTPTMEDGGSMRNEPIDEVYNPNKDNSLRPIGYRPAGEMIVNNNQWSPGANVSLIGGQYYDVDGYRVFAPNKVGTFFTGNTRPVIDGTSVVAPNSWIEQRRAAAEATAPRIIVPRRNLLSEKCGGNIKKRK